MSRTLRREPPRPKWHCGSPKAWAKFYRDCRRRARAKAQHAMRNGREPEPRYSVEHEYFD